MSNWRLYVVLAVTKNSVLIVEDLAYMPSIITIMELWRAFCWVMTFSVSWRESFGVGLSSAWKFICHLWWRRRGSTGLWLEQVWPPYPGHRRDRCMHHVRLSHSAKLVKLSIILSRGWDIRRPLSPLFSLPGHVQSVRRVKCDPFHGNIVASCSYDFSVRYMKSFTNFMVWGPLVNTCCFGDGWEHLYRE